MSARVRQDATERLSQEITEGCLVLLGEYDTDLLRAGLEEARIVNPDGWMAKMLGEYLEFWR